MKRELTEEELERCTKGKGCEFLVENGYCTLPQCQWKTIVDFYRQYGASVEVKGKEGE